MVAARTRGGRRHGGTRTDTDGHRAAKPQPKELNGLKRLNESNDADPAGEFFAACEQFGLLECRVRAVWRCRGQSGGGLRLRLRLRLGLRLRCFILVLFAFVGNEKNSGIGGGGEGGGPGSALAGVAEGSEEDKSE